MNRFFLKIDRAQIHKKYEPFSRAEVKFYSFAADQDLSIPELDIAMGTESHERIRDAIRPAVEQLMGRWESVLIENVRKDHVFEFGDTGKVFYAAGTVPPRVDWIMLAVESDRHIRDLRAHLTEILPDDEVDSIARNVVTLMGRGMNPGAEAVLSLAKFAMKALTRFMAHNGNDQVGYVEQSFIKALHYPRGDRSAQGVQDLTANMWYDYTIFAVPQND